MTLVNEVIESSNSIYMDIKGIIQLCLENQIDAVFPGWVYGYDAMHLYGRDCTTQRRNQN